MPSLLYIGLMSGTSLDGIDVALVDFADGASLIAHSHVLLPGALKAELLTLTQSNAMLSFDQIGRLETALGQAFADAVNQFCSSHNIQAKDISAIGSHGQTVRHQPYGELPFTLQLGDANIIAERTKIKTVADFRRRDVAAGGQGAPLVPAFHHALFAKAQTNRAVVNIGGIANITVLTSNGDVMGFDTGPGNGLMDAWCQANWQMPYDDQGLKAQQGEVDKELLNKLLADPWLQLPPPKSTGRDVYNLAWLNSFLTESKLKPESVLRTLNEFTARTITEALLQQCSQLDDVFICGGGIHNSLLMQSIQNLLPCNVQSTAILGVNPDYVEAMAFAWLAKQCIEGKAGNVVNVTGAFGPRILGAIYQA